MMPGGQSINFQHLEFLDKLSIYVMNISDRDSMSLLICRGHIKESKGYR